ncbi:PRC-barrel domain containing protein [Streptomyces venezuelae]|uniref:PRC-barrel domain containing protein n=1 Tax=Streptomyces venezuelae TaxID=54571 RepID=UPI00123B2CD9|nr:PRC-barrel domain containing protein [Streptomyces venezuelae]QES04452.1 PRC-barrel domain containing protein [Streptomyces venezuelae]
MTENPWTFGADCGHLPGTDLTGWDVEAADGHIGTVAEHSDEAGDVHLVVDAGGWIFGKLLVPAGAVARFDARRRTLCLSLTKEQVKDAPQFLPDRDLADRQYREDVAAYYRMALDSCP